MRGSSGTSLAKLPEQMLKEFALVRPYDLIVVQFGLGGAGTFSDGKLNTGTKSTSHRFILETFVKAGAQKNILWDAKPHVGSDVLPAVVTNIVKMIEGAGGTVAF